MVQLASERLDRGFGALADRRRREILDALAGGPATISALAGPLGVTLAGVLKHIRVLEAAGLVTTRKVGRARICELGVRPLDDLEEWMLDRSRRWALMLDRFAIDAAAAGRPQR